MNSYGVRDRVLNSAKESVSLALSRPHVIQKVGVFKSSQAIKVRDLIEGGTVHALVGKTKQRHMDNLAVNTNFNTKEDGTASVLVMWEPGKGKKRSGKLG